MGIQPPSSSRDLPTSSPHGTPTRKPKGTSKRENLHEKINAPATSRGNKLKRGSTYQRKSGGSSTITASTSEVIHRKSPRGEITQLMEEWNKYTKEGAKPILYYSKKEDKIFCGKSGVASEKLSKLFEFDQFKVAEHLLRKYDLHDDEKKALVEFTKTLFDQSEDFIAKINGQSRDLVKAHETGEIHTKGDVEWRNLVWTLASPGFKHAMSQRGYPEWPKMDGKHFV